MLCKSAQQVLSLNNVSAEELAKIDGTIYCQSEIDSFINMYGIRWEQQKTMISIADIVGYNYRFANTIVSNNIFNTYVNFFGGRDRYHSRSDSMLEITTKDPVAALTKSFEEEEIVVDEAASDKYVISSNGLHRYTILRSLYLIELAKADNIDEIEKIKAKYQIPVLVNKVDYLKTYCQFILSRLGIITCCKLELDEQYNFTGRVEVENFSGDMMIMADEELKQYTVDKLNNYEGVWQELSYEIENNQGFHEFLSTLYPLDIEQGNGR